VPPERSKIRLLIVDDEQDFLASASMALGRRGFEVETALDGRAALKLLEGRSFDAALLDLKMPGMDGIELFQRMHDAWPDLPIILLTGHISMAVPLQASRQGAVDWLTKPVEMEELARRILELVEKVQARRRLTELRGIAVQFAERVKVLIVDDETELLDSLATVLGRRGMTVSTCPDGYQALEFLQQNTVDIVVLDVKMPGIDGLETLRRIRKAHPGLDVILLTGHPSVETAMEGLKQGAAEYVMKPVEVEELVTSIRRAYLRHKDKILEPE